MMVLSNEMRRMMEEVAEKKSEIPLWDRSFPDAHAISRLPGDASTRQYFRVKDDKKNYVLMSTEPFFELKEDLPFLAVQRHLHSVGVDVPQVIEVNAKKGLIILEDLGDDTLLHRLNGAKTSTQERKLYEGVIDRLIHFQIHASPPSNQKPSNPLPCFDLAFDQEKLMWEVQFTLDNLYRGYLNRKISSKDELLINQSFESICGILSAEPRVLTHRDFHSRNIMVVADENKKFSDRLVIIDFQDARMGPLQYDLVSLLRDSYYQLEEKQTQKLINYYIKSYEKKSGKSIDRLRFQHIFDLMAVQRNFKAIGSFASFMQLRKNPTYLKYIGNTFENIRRTLTKYPQYLHLREVLFHYYYF